MQEMIVSSVYTHIFCVYKAESIWITRKHHLTLNLPKIPNTFEFLISKQSLPVDHFKFKLVVIIL